MRHHIAKNIRLSGRQIGLIALLVSACFQNLVIITIGAAAIKPYHIVALVLLVMSFFVEKSAWTFPKRPLFLTCIFVIAVSLVDAIRFDINVVLFNYIFFFILIMAVINYGRDLGLDEWGLVIRISALIVLGAVIVKDAMHIQTILGFASDNGNGHPQIPFFFGGGINLEASWLALFGVFFKRDRLGAFYLTSSLLISAGYASRVGLILSLLSITFVFLAKSSSKRGDIFKVLKLVVLLAGLALIAQAVGIPIMERFLFIGEDKGSIGRTNMWQYASAAFFDSPIFGCGAGNAISHINDISGEFFSESNIHNYFLQVLLDFGILGFLILVAMVISLVLRFKQGGYVNPFAAYILCWLVGSLFQFRGADAILAFFVAGYIATSLYGRRGKEATSSFTRRTASKNLGLVSNSPQYGTCGEFASEDCQRERKKERFR